MSGVSGNNIGEGPSDHCITRTRRVSINKMENKMKLGFSAIKLSRQCSSSTDQFRKDQSITQSAGNGYGLGAISRDSDMEVDLDLPQSRREIKEVA